MDNIDPKKFIVPQWPAPDNVVALISTRGLSHSKKDSNVEDGFSAFNLGDHVGDDLKVVSSNRKVFAAALDARIQWLKQTHSTDILDLHSPSQTQEIAIADGAISDQPGLACCVMTADCLPILMCAIDGSKVAAIHCGWRGLANGMVQHAIHKFAMEGQQIMAYLGPAISQASFEVGPEVKAAFEDAAHKRGFECPPAAFIPSKNEGKYLADLYALAEAELNSLGVAQIYGGNYCTFAESERFYSYRRSPRCGRMASAISLKKKG